MELYEFKAIAERRGHMYDNTPAASAEWARTWGLSYHSRLWRYKQYKLGNMEWKGGKVVLRHGSYKSVSCYIDGEPVSEYRFKKALATFKAPEVTPEEQAYMDARQAARDAELATYWARRHDREQKRKARQEIARQQLTFDFDAA